MKRRSESFFGLHFDFHAQPKYGLQGKSLNEEDIRRICRTLKPDFIQIDCKGHPGWASYPTELGNAMPEFAKSGKNILIVPTLSAYADSLLVEVASI